MLEAVLPNNYLNQEQVALKAKEGNKEAREELTRDYEAFVETIARGKEIFCVEG